MPEWSLTEAMAEASPTGRMLYTLGVAAFIIAVIGVPWVFALFGVEKGWFYEGSEVSNAHTPKGIKEAEKRKRESQ